MDDNRNKNAMHRMVRAAVGLLLIFAGMTNGAAADAGNTETVEIMAKQKTRHKWRPRQSVVLTQKLAATVKPDERGRYGGWKNRKGEATGFFRVESDAQGRWWLVDPDGHPFVSVGLNAVRPNNTKRGHERRDKTFGTKEKWANTTAALMHRHAFNTLGAWSYSRSIGASENPLPDTAILNLMARYSQSTGQSTQGTGHRDYPDDLIPVFDPEFEVFCQREGKKLKKFRNDPWLIGRFSDNEMPFPADMLDRFLRRPDDDHGHRAATAWLRQRQLAREAIDDTARAQFLSFAAERYFRICKEAIKANDPNHLYLGCRFHAKVLWREPVLRAAAKHLDIVSINWYAQWTPDRETMDNWVKWTNRPFLISEFFAKGMDSGLPNTSGAGWIVKTQQDRSAFYQNFALPLLQHRGCVGWHWFRYMDNDPDDVPADPTNKDANKGIVDGQFKPYKSLLDAMTLLNQRVYQLRTMAPEPDKR